METVCHVVTKLELGGAQEVALYMVSHLDRQRFRPVLVTGPGGLLDEEAKRIPGLEMLVLPALGRAIHAWSDLTAFIALIRLFRRYRPSIVHTHSSKAGILGRWAAWCAGVPIVVHTIHGYGITPQQHPLVQRLFIVLERISGWITTHWIAVSEADVRKGLRWGLFSHNVSVIRPGIDLRPFLRRLGREELSRLRREFGAGPGNWLVGTVACLKPQKAPQDFVALAKRVCDAVSDARFLLIGDGELRPLVESLRREAGLLDRFYLAGWRRDVPASMQAMDAFVLTSHWEGLPRAILEARASGLPIVATAAGGVEEALQDYPDGYVVEVGDIESLSARLNHVRKTHAKPARSTGRDEQDSPLPLEFHIEEMLKRYETLYDTLIRESHAGLIAQTPSVVR